MAAYSVIGKVLPRQDGVEKATGRAVYATDFQVPGMAWGKVLYSPHPHARIVRIDTRRAREMPGVLAVLTGPELPDRRLSPTRDRPALARDKVRFVGDAVACVAAEDEETAQAAVEAIQVEYEPLPAVFDAEEAMRDGAPLIHEVAAAAPSDGGYSRYLRVWRPIPGTNICNYLSLVKGNLDEGFAQADHIFEDTFRCPMLHHCYMEPHACLASFDAQGGLTVWTSTQTPFRLRAELARFLDLPEERVRVIATRVGGGFGGKNRPLLEPLCALLSQRTGRPVKMVLSREEEFTATAGSLPVVIRLRTGVKQDGTITARHVTLIWDTGAYGDGLVTSWHGRHSSPGPYRIPHVRVDDYLVYTNKMPTTAFRSLGVHQITWACESQMDIIAARLGIDPVELRLRNILEEGSISHTGEVLDGVNLRECLLQAARAIGWPDRAARPPNHGVGLACFHKPSAPGTEAQVRVSVHPDGTVAVASGAAEIGQGTAMVLAQLAAEELGVPLEWVRVTMGDTGTTPFDHGTFSSRVVVHAGNALCQAAAEVRARLLDMAAGVLEADPSTLELREGKVWLRGTSGPGLPLEELAQATRGVGWPVVGSGAFQGRGAYDLDLDTGQSTGRPASEWKYGAQAVEVAVDPETGQVRVLRVVVACDCGRALNPLGLEGQVEGGAMMGIGGALWEELAFHQGRVLNPSLKDYTMPTAADRVDIQSVLVEVPSPHGPYGAKGVGEPANAAIAPAIASAIYQAVGVRLTDLPLTPERLLRALREKGK